jgi:hypothetical protein
MNAWDGKPRYVDYQGQTIETFTRGALSIALNRTVTTIRAMERKGVLCHPPIKDGRGHWLYTRDQIVDLVALATEEMVIDPRYRRPFSERFIQEAHRIISRRPQLV